MEQSKVSHATILHNAGTTMTLSHNGTLMCAKARLDLQARAARITMNLIIASLAYRYTLMNTIPSPRLPRDHMNSPRPRIVYMVCPIDT